MGKQGQPPGHQLVAQEQRNIADVLPGHPPAGKARPPPLWATNVLTLGRERKLYQKHKKIRRRRILEERSWTKNTKEKDGDGKYFAEERVGGNQKNYKSPCGPKKVKTVSCC